MIGEELLQQTRQFCRGECRLVAAFHLLSPQTSW
jgi:hypothetical protein